MKRSEIEKERQRLKEQSRMDLLQKELENKQQSISQERSKAGIVKVSKSDSLDNKKFKNQAKVYMAMKPLEAAQIIETLPDEHASKILNAMNDDRQKAKILAALSTEKAARITSELGASR